MKTIGLSSLRDLRAQIALLASGHLLNGGPRAAIIAPSAVLTVFIAFTIAELRRLEPPRAHA